VPNGQRPDSTSTWPPCNVGASSGRTSRQRFAKQNDHGCRGR
jgi:hypothetical protein